MRSLAKPYPFLFTSGTPEAFNTQDPFSGRQPSLGIKNSFLTCDKGIPSGDRLDLNVNRLSGLRAGMRIEADLAGK